MRPVRFLRNNPILLLVVLVVGFTAWVVSDTTEPAPSAPSPLPPLEFVSSPDAPAIEPAKPDDRPGVITADVVPQLKPGMTRTDVEGLIGPPPAELVHPVEEVDGRLTYRATYLANLDPLPPNTVRPIPGRRSQPPAPKGLISLEFDASLPGHPLLRVHLPVPKS